ncbi:hypothetical protein GCM10010124_39230 [Pilimelia terevasa]|uniref:DUF1761 domain-containing protein n=1 Tax=Pilimelia terevasa TaxID=53372 RepID=A0A8J3BQG0_9ACTN|nr:DUF1761 domain-containing protein [Pilimelia terevasa]GGK42542.1 hypothetical protein GCM10010124_39230 [Pilimelia terevasa]
MEMFEAFGALNWLAVVLAALSHFAVGYLWYHQKVFGARWAELAGVDTGSEGTALGVLFARLGVVALATAATLGALMIATGTGGVAGGFAFCAVVGLVLRAGAHVVHNGFARRPGALTLLDGAHDVLACAVMGAILGIWT